jgi:hypothetical protein
MEIKCPCRHCGQNISFPDNMTGDWLACPHCAQQTQLLGPTPSMSQTPYAVQKAKEPGWMFACIGMLGLGAIYLTVVYGGIFDLVRHMGDVDSGERARVHFLAAAVETMALLAIGTALSLFAWFVLRQTSRKQVSLQFVLFAVTSVVLVISVVKKRQDAADATAKGQQALAIRLQRMAEAKSGLVFRDVVIQTSGGFLPKHYLKGTVTNKSQHRVDQIFLKTTFKHKVTGAELLTSTCLLQGGVEPGGTSQFFQEVHAPSDQPFDWSFEVDLAAVSSF